MIRALIVAAVAALAAGTPGTPDPTFGDGGVATYDSSVSLVAPRLAPAAGGGFVLLGGKRSAGGPFVIRYDHDGKLVRGFAREGVAGSEGFVGLQGWDAARPLPDGDEIVVGEQIIGIFDQYVLVARLRPDGSLDPQFGRRGRLRQRFGTKGCTETDPVAALEQGPKTVLLTSTCPPARVGNIGAAVARITPQGLVDRSFGTRGVTFLTPIVGNSNPDSLGRQHDGKILVGIGGDEGAAAVARLLPNGRPDTSFGRRGYVAFHRGPETRLDPISGVFELDDGTVLAVGCLTTRAPVLYRISAHGAVEGSTVVSGVDGCLSSPVQIGNDVVGGSSDAVVRLSPDGAVVWSTPSGSAVSGVLRQGREVVTAATLDPGAGRYGYELARLRP